MADRGCSRPFCPFLRTCFTSRQATLNEFIGFKFISNIIFLLKKCQDIFFYCSKKSIFPSLKITSTTGKLKNMFSSLPSDAMWGDQCIRVHFLNTALCVFIVYFIFIFIFKYFFVYFVGKVWIGEPSCMVLCLVYDSSCLKEKSSFAQFLKKICLLEKWNFVYLLPFHRNQYIFTGR